MGGDYYIDHEEDDKKPSFIKTHKCRLIISLLNVLLFGGSSYYAKEINHLRIQIKASEARITTEVKKLTATGESISSGVDRAGEQLKKAEKACKRLL